MPLKVAKLAGKTAQTSFEYDGETVNLTYYPDRYTPNLVANLVAVASLADINADELAMMEAGSRRFREILGGTAPALDALVGAVHTLLESWDIEGENGEPYPTTVEALSELPFSFLSAVLGAIQGDSSPATPGKA